MNPYGLHKGDIVEIHFIDHGEDVKTALPFIVWGRLEKVTNKFMRIVSWGHEDRKLRGKKDFEENTEKTFTIVSSAITELRILRRR